jgi:twitching motility protein PilT
MASYNMDDLLIKCVQTKASDLHITVGIPPMLRIYGELTPVGEEKLDSKDTLRFVKDVTSEEQFKKFEETGELDFSYSLENTGRFRVNAYHQRGSCALALRSVGLKIPTLEDLNMPAIMKTLCVKQRGLVLVTGPTGSGKSTTLAAMIDEINTTSKRHIITLEDPIEYMHRHKKSMVNQREVGDDTKSFSNALRAALREDPDVILVGEMRDLETISIAITAAETGHLVFSTLHTIGASKTVDRVIDVFPPFQQEQIKVQLAAVLEGVISQHLLQLSGGNGRTAALEIMTATPAIRNIIREGKTHQIDSMVQTGGKMGMVTMDMSLADLYRRGIVNYDEAESYCVDKDVFKRLAGMSSMM